MMTRPNAVTRWSYAKHGPAVIKRPATVTGMLQKAPVVEFNQLNAARIQSD
jgi:hypothetical protein